MAIDYRMRIDAANIGCHSTLRANFTFKERIIGIFASNGSGKTTISRMLRLCDKAAPQYEIKRTDLLISLGQSIGNYKFSLNPTTESEQFLQVQIERNRQPQITNDTPYIFHVFNQDYIDENLAIKHYAFDGNISGVIIGKDNIDISELEEKKRLHAEKLEIEMIKVKDIISDSLGKLDLVPVNKNTLEYKNLKYQNIYLNESFPETEKYEVLLSKYKVALTMPEDIQDILKITLFPNEIKLFEGLTSCLVESYSVGKIAQDFKDKVMLKDDFIRKGLEVMGDDKTHCPFCEQIIQSDAGKLIDDYIEYFKDEETKIIEVIRKYIRQLEDVFTRLGEKYNEYLSRSKSFNEFKKYIPSLMDTNFTDVDDPIIIKRYIDSLISLAEIKKQNIANVITSFSEQVDRICSFIDALNIRLRATNNEIDAFNSAKQKMNEEKLNLRRRLCNSMYCQAFENCQSAILEIRFVEKELKDIDAKIEEETNKFKSNKKDKVAETFQEYLKIFFGDKYIFDPKTFCITFKDKAFTSDIDSILSHGEKNILALCHYLAATHKIVDHELDYEKLFFVIDDPVSSMDFYYVYAVAQVIKRLSRKFSEQGVPILVLTHSLEFMSIIVRNNVIKQKYILCNGELKKLGDELIMPYEEHLRDIYNIAIGKNAPNHTTANSIRHVLETIWRFERPDQTNLGEYITGLSSPIFEENAYLFSLIQDLSHGSLRTEIPYSPECIIEGCKCIIDFVKVRYWGQITRINR